MSSSFGSCSTNKNEIESLKGSISLHVSKNNLNLHVFSILYVSQFRVSNYLTLPSLKNEHVRTIS